MSPNKPMKIQMSMNQKKNATIDQIASQKVKLAGADRAARGEQHGQARSRGRTGRPMNRLAVATVVMVPS